MEGARGSSAHDHLVRAQQDRRRHCKTERLGGLEVQDHPATAASRVPGGGDHRNSAVPQSLPLGHSRKPFHAANSLRQLWPTTTIRNPTSWQCARSRRSLTRGPRGESRRLSRTQRLKGFGLTGPGDVCHSAPRPRTGGGGGGGE
jgi:hypothetical protein